MPCPYRISRNDRLHPSHLSFCCKQLLSSLGKGLIVLLKVFLLLIARFSIRRRRGLQRTKFQKERFAFPFLFAQYFSKKHTFLCKGNHQASCTGLRILQAFPSLPSL